MQSYTTQAHQRNYQGKVIFADHQTPRKHSRRHSIAIWVLVCAVAVSTSLLGVMTLHNQQLKHRLHALETQSVTAIAPQANAHVQQPKRGKTLPRIPISEQQHETENLPIIN